MQEQEWVPAITLPVCGPGPSPAHCAGEEKRLTD
ncbi:hypothetical protein DEFR109230_18790 [Deinococcus frigens]